MIRRDTIINKMYVLRQSGFFTQSLWLVAAVVVVVGWWFVVMF